MARTRKTPTWYCEYSDTGWNYRSTGIKGMTKREAKSKFKKWVEKSQRRAHKVIRCVREK